IRRVRRSKLRVRERESRTCVRLHFRQMIYCIRLSSWNSTLPEVHHHRWWVRGPTSGSLLCAPVHWPPLCASLLAAIHGTTQLNLRETEVRLPDENERVQGPVSSAHDREL